MNRQAIGIDVGGSSIKAARVDPTGAIADVRRIGTPSSASAVADQCRDLARDLLTEQVVGVGIGSAGFVESGVHVWGPHVAGPSPIGESVMSATGRPAVMDNDANVAALAELRLGAARGYANAVVIMLGTGIGGGIIVDGRVQRGRGFAGEFGHLVVDPNGPACECGRHGCWETFVSGSVLDAEAVRLAAADPGGSVAMLAREGTASGEDLMLAARDGDGAALDAWSRVGRWLGRGVANLVAILDPEVAVIGGAPSAAGDLLLDPAREALAASLHGSQVRTAPSLAISHFGQNGVVIGAGLLALEDFDD